MYYKRSMLNVWAENIVRGFVQRISATNVFRVCVTISWRLQIGFPSEVLKLFLSPPVSQQSSVGEKCTGNLLIIFPQHSNST